MEALFRRGKAKSQLGQTESARLDFLKAIGTLQGTRRSFGSFVGRGTRQGSVPKAGGANGLFATRPEVKPKKAN